MEDSRVGVCVCGRGGCERIRLKVYDVFYLLCTLLTSTIVRLSCSWRFEHPISTVDYLTKIFVFHWYQVKITVTVRLNSVRIGFKQSLLRYHHLLVRDLFVFSTGLTIRMMNEDDLKIGLDCQKYR